VKRVPARRRPGEQARICEQGQRARRRFDTGTLQGRGQIPTEVRAGNEAEQPEQPGRRRREGRIRQVERHPHRHLIIAIDRQPAQPVVRGELTHLVGDGLIDVQRQVRGGDPQRKRQKPAQSGQRTGRLRLGINPPAQHATQQRERLGRGEHIQREVRGPVQGNETTEPVPAGDDHHDAGIAGQQRAYLLCAARVVEHDHHPPVGEHGAVQAGGQVHVDRHLIRRHAESREKTGERLERHHRRCGAWPRRFTYNWPSANRSRTRCAQ